MSSELGTKAEKNLDATVQGQHSAMGVNSGIHGKPHHEPMTTSGVSIEHLPSFDHRRIVLTLIHSTSLANSSATMPYQSTTSKS